MSSAGLVMAVYFLPPIRSQKSFYESLLSYLNELLLTLGSRMLLEATVSIFKLIRLLCRMIPTTRLLNYRRCILLLKKFPKRTLLRFDLCLFL